MGFDDHEVFDQMNPAVQPPAQQAVQPPAQQAVQPPAQQPMQPPAQPPTQPPTNAAPIVQAAASSRRRLEQAIG